MPVTLELLDGFTDRPSRCRVFYCYATTKWFQEVAIYFLMVKAFRKNPKKRYAELIHKWFIRDEIEPELGANAYLTPINIGGETIQKLNSGFGAVISNVKTISQKVASEGGGVAGFFKAMKNKLIGHYKPSAELFNCTLSGVIQMMSDVRYGMDIVVGGHYQPDGDYQPNGRFSDQVSFLKRKLDEAGFDPDSLGIY